MDKLNNLLVELSVPAQAAEARAAARHVVEIVAHHAVETTVLPAAEARLLRMSLRYQHVESSAPRAAVKSQAVARLPAEITAQPAVVRPAVE